ncbi:11637_t:CDS:2 [Scutellospora calospora]|uniref:11637_t:CDS:1 n=1 Tax=Scutellospora calospora TaxID=85575 RepID=A0ACA9LK00_9GLOM|nr:11637_t:CDS:2 [Scutellospora calospora]
MFDLDSANNSSSNNANINKSFENESSENREIIKALENREIVEFLDKESDNMLEKERQQFEEENIKKGYVNEDKLLINDITHPAIDTNTK